ncbi:hypothetical protein EYR40_003155 [Pleurotus pulmonarius]|nr:hypothetical protein EYR40_003155 [Pleurotus pulmonarius]
MFRDLQPGKPKRIDIDDDASTSKRYHISQRTSYATNTNNISIDTTSEITSNKTGKKDKALQKTTAHPETSTSMHAKHRGQVEAIDAEKEEDRETTLETVATKLTPKTNDTKIKRKKIEPFDVGLD